MWSPYRHKEKEESETVTCRAMCTVYTKLKHHWSKRGSKRVPTTDTILDLHVTMGVPTPCPTCGWQGRRESNGVVIVNLYLYRKLIPLFYSFFCTKL